MWIYEKKLEIPVRVSIPDPRMAKLLITQYGGPDNYFYVGAFWKRNIG